MKLSLGLIASIALVAAPFAATAQTDAYVGPKLLVPGTNATKSAGKGVVTVQVFVKKDGTFSVNKVLKTTNPSDNEAALEIAKTSKYKAAIRNGKPVGAFYDYALTFGGDNAATGGAPMVAVMASIRAAKYDDAKAQLATYLQAHPDDTQAYTLLGVANGFGGDDAGAAAAFQKAGTIPDQYKAVALQSYSKYATALLDQKKFPEAVAVANHAIELDPNNLQSFYVRGMANYQVNDAASIADLQKARSIAAANKADDKTLASLSFNIAMSQLDAGQFGEAATSAKDAARLDPPKGVQLDNYAYAAINNAAVTLANSGKTADAVSRLESGANAFPSAGPRLLGQAAYIMATDKKPDWKKVSVEADKALALDSTEGRANFMRGVAAAQQSDPKEAQTYLVKAKASPSYGTDPALAKQIDDTLKQLNVPAK